MTRPNVAKAAQPQFKKGAQAPKISVPQNMRVREGGQAPHIATPPTVPTTSGPVSVTKRNS
jgi:hypothetical protein